jgi:hypothetical protein
MSASSAPENPRSRRRALALACAGLALALAAPAGAQPGISDGLSFDTSIRSGDARGLELAIQRGTSELIYLPRGVYVLNNPVVIDRTRPLRLFGADRFATALVARNTRLPLFVVRAAPKFNLTSINLFPTAYQRDALNARVIYSANTQPVAVEVQDCNVDRAALEFAGPGSYRIQSSVFTPGGFTRAAIIVDHPQADLLLFGGDITNGPERLRTDAYAHVWQKRGRVRLYAATLEATLGDADVRIETASALGPHILGNLRSEGANGALNRRGVSRLLVVPPTRERVDVLVKGSGGAWDTGANGTRDQRMNCKFVSYNAAGTLWLIGNRAEGPCGRALVEGTAPGATIVSIGNIISSPEAFPVSGARIFSRADAYNFFAWSGGRDELPWMRWIPEPAGSARIESTAGIPPPPEDVLPAALDRPVLTAALPGMQDVRNFGALGDGKKDDTAALQAALDAGCDPRLSKQLYLPAGTYRIRDTLYLRHHSGGRCHIGTTMGGWIAGAGSGRTIIAMDPDVKKGTFATDGLIYATIQGIAFKTYPWKPGEPEEPNVDLEMYPGHVATQLNNFYDVVFNGGYAAFATGVRPPTNGQCSSNMVFGGTMTNAHFGFVSGQYNAIANGVYDSLFLNNDIALGSWTKDEKLLPPGGTVFAYRSRSRGTRVSELELRGTGSGSTFYAYEWNSDAPAYFKVGPAAAPWPLLFDRSHLAPRPGTAPLFDVGTAQGPIFLFSTVTGGKIRVGQTGAAQNYAIKVESDIAGWKDNELILPNGKLEDIGWGGGPKLGAPGAPQP